MSNYYFAQIHIELHATSEVSKRGKECTIKNHYCIVEADSHENALKEAMKYFGYNPSLKEKQLLRLGFSCATTKIEDLVECYGTKEGVYEITTDEII